MKFGLSLDDANRLISEQNGNCGICNETSGTYDGVPRRLALEHDHRNGKFRGFVCNRCNHVLGLVMDDVSLLGKMSDYLRRAEVAS